MPIKHVVFAFMVALIWGLNFIFVKFSLDEIPPFLLCALRFLLASVPAIFLVKPPNMPFRMTSLYGFIMFALQFGFLFMGMSVGMTPGMASLIMQIQIFFSMIFAALILGEKPSFYQLIGGIVSFIGISLVAFHFDNHISFLGFLCILCAAATWGLGNLITKSFQRVNMVSLVVWGCFIASIPMLLLSYIIEGPDNILNAYHHLSMVGLFSLLYTVYFSTLIGYGIWNWLLSLYPVGTVVPFTLLVPIIGIFSSVVMLHEPLQHWKIVSGLLVITGLYINLQKRKPTKQPENTTEFPSVLSTHPQQRESL